MGITSSSVPKIAHQQLTGNINGTLAEREVDEGRAARRQQCRYYWRISTLKASPDAPPGDKMFLSFSIPTSLLPVPYQCKRNGWCAREFRRRGIRRKGERGSYCRRLMLLCYFVTSFLSRRYRKVYIG